MRPASSRLRALSAASWRRCAATSSGFHLPLGFQGRAFFPQGAKLVQAVVPLALKGLLAHFIIAGRQPMYAAEEAAGPWVVGRIGGAAAQHERAAQNTAGNA